MPQILAFCIIDPHWNSAGSQNHSLGKTQTPMVQHPLKSPGHRQPWYWSGSLCIIWLRLWPVAYTEGDEMAANGITVPYSLHLWEFTFWIPGNPHGIKAISKMLQESTSISKKQAWPAEFSQICHTFHWNSSELVLNIVTLTYEIEICWKLIS